MGLSNIFGQKQGQGQQGQGQTPQQPAAPYNPFAGTAGAQVFGGGAKFQDGEYLVALTDIETFQSRNPRTGQNPVVKVEGTVVQRLSATGTEVGGTAANLIHMRHANSPGNVKAVMMAVLQALAERGGANPADITDEAMQADAVAYDAAILQVVQGGLYKGVVLRLFVETIKTDNGHPFPRHTWTFEPGVQVVEG